MSFLLSIVALFSAAHAAPVPPELATVIVQETKLEANNIKLILPVKVESKIQSSVRAEAEGLVTNLKLPLGARVKAGQVVMTIQNKDPGFTYAAVPVRSPVAGVISQITPSLMSRVSRGDALFTVIDPKSIRMSAEVPGDDLRVLPTGQKGKFTLDLGSDQTIAITVAGISPSVDARTGTASAELTFDQMAEAPAIGSVGHAVFNIEKGKVLQLPESAIGYTDGKPHVKVVDANGKVSKKDVELGEQRESLLVIKSGLNPGERVIVRASRTVKDGETVKIESGKNS